MEAVNQNPLAMEFVKFKKHILKIIKENGLALEFVENKTVTICMEAVKQNGLALEFRK